MGGRNFASFISDVLGIAMRLPDVITELAKPRELRSSLLRIVLPLDIGTLTLSVGDGQTNNQSGTVLDITVASTSEVPPNVAAMMKLLDAAHGVISKIFLELTRPIHKLMEPKEN
jgi:uncharacterized protein (TIGR04255 family)